MKLKIIKSEREMEGSIQEAIVKPFGTSAHISLGKKHLGKVINVIIPTHPKYIWLLSDAELNEIIEVCHKIIKKEKSSRIQQLKLDAIEHLKNARFGLNDLIKTLEILKESKEHQYLVGKIQEIYNLS